MSEQVAAVTTDELAQAHASLTARQAARQEMEELLRATPKAVEGPQKPAEQLQVRPEDFPSVGDVARGVARGGVEGIAQGAVGGPLAAMEEAGQGLTSFSEFLRDHPVLKFAPAMKEAETLTGFIGKSLQALPDYPQAETELGGASRSISQFLTGFLPANRLVEAAAAGTKVGRALKAGKVGKVLEPAAAGAITDLSVFDPHEQRLSNLVQEYPAIANPISELLAADPTDTEAEGRFKNAIEGLGFGAVADLVGGAVRVIRAGRRARAGVMAQEQGSKQMLEQVERTNTLQRSRFKELIGDPQGEAVVTRTEGGQRDIFVNWARINSDEDVKEMVQKLANQHADEINKARRGETRSFETVKLDAAQLDAWETLASRKVGQPLSDAESFAVRELWVRSGRNVLELAQRVKAEPGNEIVEAAFNKSIVIHNSIQEQVVAARTETARALAQWRIPAGDTAEFAGQMEQLTALTMSQSRDTQAVAEGVLNLANKGLVREADAFIYGARAAVVMGAVRQFWYFSLLSGPHTHVRNMLSQTAVIGQQIMERKLANVIGKVTGSQAIPDGETTAMMFGAVQGFRDAFRVSASGRSAFREAWETGGSGAGIGKVELPLQGFSAGVSRDNPYGRALSFIDTATRLPTRALAASDEVFKSIGFRMELQALAYRQAHGEMTAGMLEPALLKDRVTTLINNPDEELRMAARLKAEEVTFTKSPSRDSRVYKFLRDGQNIPVIGRIAFAFTRTPYNIAEYGFQRTPLALATKQFRSDISAGGARGDLAYSRFLSGSAALMTMVDMAWKGDITGEGPADPRERETLMRAGWQPYSIKVGDRYFSYRGMEPLAMSLGMAANMTEILSSEDFGDENKDVNDVVIAASMSIAQQALAPQYMTGLASLIEAMNDPARYGETFVQRLAASVVPTGVAQVNRTLVDPIAREVSNELDAIRARTPGLSATLPAKRDRWGQPISYASGFGAGYDLMVPIYGSRDDAQPIDQELIRMGTPLGRPSRSQSFDGVTVNLERFPAAYSRLLELSGNAMTHKANGVPIDAMTGLGQMDTLNLLVTGQHPMSGRYLAGSNGPDGTKLRRIRNISEGFEDAAREQVLAEFPDLAAEVAARRSERPGRLQVR